jgi:RecA/RadA recombinase
MRQRKGGAKSTNLDSLPAPKAAPNPFSDLPKGLSRAAEVLDRTRAIRTVFPDFNRKVKVGGLPVRRIHTISGPTHGGKTAFIGGLIRSFVDAGHLANYIDAEFATPLDFFEDLLERKLTDTPNLLGDRPSCYEETIDKVDTFLNYVIKKRREDNPNLASLIVVDSINKLVPTRELEKLRKEGGDAIDKGWGRLRAQYNQAWLDHLVPLLNKAECAFVVIAQEREDQAQQGWGAFPEHKVKGGAALEFDASLLIRVSKGTMIRMSSDPSSEPIGFKHKITIRKSKVASLDGRTTTCEFHLSNGKLVRFGFDMARDALEVGTELGIVKASGSYLSFAKHKWQGINRAVEKLTNDRNQLRALLDAIAERIDKDASRGGA